MGDRKSEFIARLEETGEDGVRENLTLGRYGGDHIGWATHWLDQLNQARADASNVESRRVTRSAKNAAWAAAIAAIIAAVAAIASAVIAYRGPPA
jgi:hypothetical protein